MEVKKVRSIPNLRIRPQKKEFIGVYRLYADVLQRENSHLALGVMVVTNITREHH